jgi:hypothetical protein
LNDRRGKRGMIVSDNGTEFTCNAMLNWSEDNQIVWHFIAGNPMQNGFLPPNRSASIIGIVSSNQRSSRGNVVHAFF